MTAAVDCPFCLIVAGEAPATIIVRRWAEAFAIVPLNPVVDGHLLVISTRHVPNAATDPALTGYIAARAAALGGELGRDFNFIVNAGPDASQTIDHLHGHVVPRRPGDGLALPWTVTA